MAYPSTPRQGTLLFFRLLLLPVVVLGIACSSAAPSSAPTPPPAGAPSAAPAGGSVAPSISPQPARAASAVPSPSTSAGGAAGAATGPNAGSVTQITVQVAAYSANYAPIMIGIEKGYYAQQGLSVTLVQMPGSTATPAVLTGEVAFGTSPAAALTAMLQGAPLKIIYVQGDRARYQLWSTTPTITTVQQLVGKVIGVEGRGDSSELAARIYLQNHGVSPDSVDFSALGSAGRIPVAESGALPALTMGTNDLATIGGTVPNGVLLADLEHDVQLISNGVVTSDQEMQNRPDVEYGFLYATLQGRAYYQTFKDQTLAIIAQYNGLTPDQNESDYDDSIQDMTPDGTLPDDALQADALARSDIVNVPASQIPPVSALYDFSALRRATQALAASGWTPQP